MLAEKLGKSLSEITELSTLELQYWLGYINLDYQERMKTMKNSKTQPKGKK